MIEKYDPEIRNFKGTSRIPSPNFSFLYKQQDFLSVIILYILVDNYRLDLYSRNLNQWIVINYPVAYFVLIISEVQLKKEECNV